MEDHNRDFRNSGYISANKYKESDKQPDYRGKLDVDGVAYELAGWVREKDGRKFLSLKVQRPRDNAAATRTAPPPQSATADLDIDNALPPRRL